MSALLLRRVEVDGRLVDVRLAQGKVDAIAPPGTLDGPWPEVSCDGGALIPGLHDHHLHLLAMGAAGQSVDVSHDLDGAIREAHGSGNPGDWIRAVGYDESESGGVDRWRLDDLAPGTPVHVQHRSGSMWVLSSTALDHVGAHDAPEEGIERLVDGTATGRLFRLDEWLHHRLPEDAGPDLGAVGRRLSSFGVTGVTDCTPTASPDYWQVLAGAIDHGDLPFTVAVTGGPELARSSPPGALLRGPVKIVIADHALPELERVVGWMRGAHDVGRPVATHCVTRSALVLALTAWQVAGSVPGDRIEHASVTPTEMISTMAELGIAVVTQPAFLAARGDDYRREVEPEDHGDLYRCASLLAGGVEVGGSTDAPFGPDDPWLAIRSASDRRSAGGTRIGADRDLQPRSALDLFLAPLDRPGGPARQVCVGAPADLCLLGVSMKECLEDPSNRHVAVTIANGAVTYLR